MTEIWKEIPTIPCYEASTLGNIRSVDRVVRKIDGILYTYKGHVLSKKINKQGREEVSIHNKTYQVHRLIAITFIDNPNNYPQVNHKDENPRNNKVDNLEWCTSVYNNTYNNKHIRVGVMQEKAVYQIDDKGNVVKLWKNGNEAAKAIGGTRSGIRNACSCYQGYNKYKGYIWTYNPNNIIKKKRKKEKFNININ